MSFRSSYITHERSYLETKIGLMQPINPKTGEVEVDFNKMKAMSTEQLRELYNDMAAKNVARFASRKDAERRVMEEAKRQGKWTEADETGDTGPVPYSEAQTGPGEPTEADPGRGKSRKGKKAAEKPTPAAVEAPSKKGKKEAPKKKEAAAPAKRSRGAPVKNPTLTAIDPKSKTYNPKGFKPQATSDRMVVLDFIRSKKGQQTRDQIVEHFDKTRKNDPVNVDAAIYYLVKFGFCRASE